METNEKKEFIDEFKDEWRSMWRNRLDDKVRAEGIADKDYSLLSVDRGTVIIATRKFKLLDFKELLRQHDPSSIGQIGSPSPLMGGWGKFIKMALGAQNVKRPGRLNPPQVDRRVDQQLKKGGRGWLHFKR